MIVVSGGRRGGGSGGTTPIGNGPVSNLDGQLVGQAFRVISPLIGENVDMKDGPFILRMPASSVMIGKGIGLNGNTTASQPIELKGGNCYIIDQFVPCNPTGTATAMTGGVYTRPNKLGTAILPASTTYTALVGTDPDSCFQIAPLVFARRRLNHVHFCLTTANGSAITFDLEIWGRICEILEG